MSSPEASGETVEKRVKDVEASYKAFLWREISRIRNAQVEGDYATAIEYATSLVVYLPIAVKEQLQGRAESIREDLRAIAGNTSGADWFTKNLNRAKVRTRMSKIFLEEFMNILSTELDKREVYIERLRRAVPTGFE